jgi:hypothetical protein
MARMFVAVWPPPEVVAELSALDRPEAPGLRWSTPAQWMVKVRPLGHVGDRLTEPLVDALEAELDGAPAVDCVLGPATYRLGGQWLGVPVTGLDDLGAAVFAATEELVPVTHPQPFKAAVVLARGRGAEGAGGAAAVGVVDGPLGVPGGRPLVPGGRAVRAARRGRARDLTGRRRRYARCWT